MATATTKTPTSKSAASTKAKRDYSLTAQSHTTPVKELPRGKVKNGRQSKYISTLAKIRDEFPGQWVLIMTSGKDSAASNTKANITKKVKGNTSGWGEVNGAEYEFAVVTFDDDVQYEDPDGKVDATVKSALYAKYIG